MFSDLMKDLSDKYHLIAPDYPGFGRSGEASLWLVIVVDGKYLLNSQH